MSTQPDNTLLMPDPQSADSEPEPTLRGILSAVTACNSSIDDLTGEVKGMKVELALVYQNMQKFRDGTTALEGRLSNMEDEWQPLQ